MEECGKLFYRKIFHQLEFFYDVVYIVRTMSFTYQPKKRKRSKTHGFLVRQKTANGRNVIKRRRSKGRARIAV